MTAAARFALRSVRALDPNQNFDRVVDLVVDAGVLRACEPGAARSLPADFPVREAAGKVVLPGLIDLRARLGEPGFEYREDLASGLRAAAAGGFVAVCALPETQPINDDAAITRALCAAGKQLGLTELLPVAAATRGMKGEQLSNVAELQAAGAIALSDGDHSIASAIVLRRLLEYAASFGMLVMQHPRDASLSHRGVFHEGAVSSRLGLTGFPRAAETVALARDLELVAATGAPLHVSTLSAARSLQQIRAAKAQGLPVTADVAVHHLLFDETHVPDFDARFRVEPPLREVADREALIDALRDGTLDAVVSDHRPQTALDRDCEFPEAEPGFAGLQLVLPALWRLVRAGRLDALRVAQVLTTQPASILRRTAPGLRVGSPATLTLFDPACKWTPARGEWFSKCTNTPLFNEELLGQVTLTVLNGNVIHQFEESHES